MDVISIPDIKKFYRIVPSHKGIFVIPIDAEESKFKLVRVENKNILKNKNIQFAFHDGSTIFFKSQDAQTLPDVDYKTFDVLKISLPEKKSIEKLKIRKGNFAIIIGGKNIGKNGRIVDIEKTVAKKRRNALVIIEDDKNNKYQTIMNFIFVVGKTKSLISLAEITQND